MPVRPPLEGVRILAISQFGAGPFGTTVLSDMGAEVIKIEDPGAGGDVARYVPPFEIDRDSLYFQAFNRGKKSVTLNLRTESGMAVLHDLVKESDGVYNNLRGDLPAKLGLDYDALGKFNEKVVCCSLSGFGSTGPRVSEPGYDHLIQAYAGYMSLTGEPDAPPAKCGVSIIDFAGGYASVLGLMIGLFDAQRTGTGRNVDVSLLDTGIAMLSYFASWTLNRDWEPTRQENSSHQTLLPSQNFRTRDGWIVVFCAKEKFYENLVVAMGRPDMATDPRFNNFAARLKHREELIPELQREFEKRDTEAWLADLRGGVPCAPVNSVADALQDQQVLARKMILEVEHPEYGTMRQVASPIKTEGMIEKPTPGPGLGEHTDQVLAEVLGYSDERVSSLRAEGAFGN
ncbi:MAG: CoA transferase [Chloroflexi bacterium]|jgi:crotonobetainyl-CoA:carnitine CoA-transferase CaiB-like acyl-CoA transferase|nr:CoA transferase [Chloroflexota bacterium]MBT4073344.1 CoA transferase [Chloroflexota bacterium]MBT4514649.1 CoA transferase [Chloroflexota bacterium]MBT5320729.1 CoA transferase [Chloroflexota bacterium]MBT6681153.1 CoA transferase [Chloroflexota bacterium]